VVDLTLEVRPSNLNAINLYIKSGFKQVSVRKAYYNNGEDAFLMYKRLGSD
jgi:ribosomal-protein-alanine N-acetyltransferase